MKILVLGHARHGKDEFANLLGLPFKSSSEAALDIFLFDTLQNYLKERGLGQYKDKSHAYQDRVHEREFWYNKITEFNLDNPIALATEILKISDIYVGMRNIKEYEACVEANMFDEIFWVDALQRKPEESKNSFTIPFQQNSMTYIDNNGSLPELHNIAKEVRESRQYGS